MSDNKALEYLQENSEILARLYGQRCNVVQSWSSFAPGLIFLMQTGQAQLMIEGGLLGLSGKLLG